MGYGLEVVKNSYAYQDEAAIVVYSTLGYMTFMWIFDSQYWPRALCIISWFSIFVAFSVSMCLLVALIPYGPICVFTVLMPLSLFGIKKLMYDQIPGHVYAGWVHGILVTMASITVACWFYWNTKNGNMWDSPTNAIYSHASGCAVDFDAVDAEVCENADYPGVPCFWNEDYTEVSFSADSCTKRCLDIYQACEEGFITWANPGLASMAMFAIGFICKYLQEPDDPHAKHQIRGVFRSCVLFLFLFWIYASLAGAGEGLSSSLIAFAISMGIGSGIVFAVVFWGTIVSEPSRIVGKATRQVEKYSDLVVSGPARHDDEYTDFVRGYFLLGFGPFIVLYGLISIVNQYVRRHLIRNCCRKRVPRAAYEHNGLFTLAVTRQINDYISWDHTKVLTYAIYWGVNYAFLNVFASKFTTVFLSWFVQYTSTMGLSAVTLIVLFVGMTLFMIPIMPGLPIYLTGGIVLVSAGHDILGRWGSICYACAVSLFLKLLACAVQQKIIGQRLGGSISVKQMVSINSEGIRAMRVMLSDKGITSRKVAVLVGGPDWPVGVLCGILGLDLCSVLVGTLPVVAVIVPSVFVGSFAYLGSLENDDGMDLYPWSSTMGAIASTFAAGAMFYFTLSAAAAVKHTLKNSKDAINAIPLDEAVQEANVEAEERRTTYERVTIWRDVPTHMKYVLVTAVLSMMGCCFLLVIFNESCFRDYDLMYTIGNHLGGSWTNLVLPMGRIALMLFAISCVLLYIFESWATAKTTAELKSIDVNRINEPLTSIEMSSCP
mmetsp:Transcript_27067/g.32809  ORF Transcript_27067/g.32809 Transcript_27067/m.32809 type:complete len:773 (-) Transcript_27067:127-2445(-)